MKRSTKSGSAVDKMKPTKGPTKPKPLVYTEVQDGHMKMAKSRVKKSTKK
jgi:hypothetical protein